MKAQDVFDNAQHRFDCTFSQAVDGTATLSVEFVADLSYRFWIKANNFQGLFESLPHYVATIKLSYIEISLDYIPLYFPLS